MFQARALRALVQGNIKLERTADEIIVGAVSRLCEQDGGKSADDER
jgi:hypothetical protein